MATGDRALLEIDTKQAEWLRAKLASRAKSLSAKRTVMGQVVVLIDRWIQKNFQTEGQYAYPGEGWKPLSPLTIRARMKTERAQRASAKRGKVEGTRIRYVGGRVMPAGVKILQDNGELRRLWRHYYDNDSAIIQSGVDYGIYHDSDAPRTKLPQRKITPTEKQIMPELIKILGTHVRTSLRK